MTISQYLKDSAATERWAQALAATRPEKAVVYLHGDLGAGKSSVARAMLRALGVVGAIKSPTYTLVERYVLSDGEAWHLDLYRIGDPTELSYLGLDDDSAMTLCLIEWPDRGASGMMPPVDLHLWLTIQGEGRQIRLLAASNAGRQWMMNFSPYAESVGII